MKKFLAFLLTLGLLAVTAFVVKRYEQNADQVIPYPYLFSSETARIQSPSTPILIVGDRMAVQLSRFKYVLEEQLSQGSLKKVEVKSMAQDKEGMHRTLKKIQSLKKLPKIIIYMGASQEWYEQKFSLNHIETTKRNLKLYQDSLVKSLLMFVPHLAPLLYEPIDYITLGAQLNPQRALNDTQILQKQELLYLLYEHELDEFLSYVKAQGSIPIIINTPINLDSPPEKVCSTSTNEQINKQLQRLYLDLKKGDPKSVLEESLSLQVQATGNAMLHFVRGQAYKRLNNKEKAIKELHLASGLDCGQWRGNPIYQVIQKKYAQQHEVLYFNFAKMLRYHWMDDIVFYDNFYPQNLYFEKAVQQIARSIQEIVR